MSFLLVFVTLSLAFIGIVYYFMFIVYLIDSFIFLNPKIRRVLLKKKRTKTPKTNLTNTRKKR